MGRPRRGGSGVRGRAAEVRRAYARAGSTDLVPGHGRAAAVACRVHVPPYTALAGVYDRLMQDVPYADWARFVLAQAVARGVRPRRALELGCGTGSFTVLLEAAGLEVVAVDASAAMLAVAGTRLARSRLLTGDVREVPTEGRFELVAAVFEVVNHMLEDDALARLADHVRRRLAPGGVWAFDVTTAAGLADLWPGGRAEGWADDVRYRWRHAWDARSRIATVEAWCEGPGGAFVEVHRQRAYDPPELRRTLRAAGFAEVDVVTFPDAAPAGDDADAVWVFAR